MNFSKHITRSCRKKREDEQIAEVKMEQDGEDDDEDQDNNSE